MEQEVYLIADTHFGHTNIIPYESRPFSDVEEMDRELVKRWNETVGKQDLVFVLGDFSFYGKERTAKICKALQGKKVLIMGNHDSHSVPFYLECGFAEVSRYPIVYEGYWILSHEPLYMNAHMPYANIFGHVHGSTLYKDVSAQSFCVSAERIDYRPISFAEVKQAVTREMTEKETAGKL